MTMSHSKHTNFIRTVKIIFLQPATDPWQSKVIQQSPWVHNYPTTSILHDNLLLQEYDQRLHCSLAN